jgi:diguanylate cyclase (GGDEF)-like protein/PAS domain S-box-containing protein
MWIVVSTTVGLAACCLAVAAWKWRRERSLTLRLHAVEEARSGLAGAQEHYKQLAESRDSIFQSAPLCMIAMDSDGTITAMNLAAEKLTGYTREELVGTASISILHDEKELDSRAAELAASGTAADGDDRFAVLTANASRGEIEEREWNYVRRDGSRIPVSVAMRAVTSEAGAVSGYVGVATDISERKQMLARMTHLATHDHLTKLAGRALLQENLAQAVERARRYGTRVAVFLVDLDQLKRVNDSLGHTNGDKVLVEIAGRLRRAVRSSDTVARVGGDEFVVVMPDIMNFGDVEQCGMNLIQLVSPPMMIEDHEVHVTASVGACIYPDFAADAKHLLKRADAAMYAAKEEGRNQCRIFSENMLKVTADRLSMEHVLRHALANGELSMHYQPQISLVSGAVIGMEALLRWTHPKLGQVPPSIFIPLAEETGLIVQIGAWAFKTACGEAMKMRQELGMDLTISVNLSPRQFQQKNLLQVIESALKSSRLPPQCLEIEITENMVMLNSESNLDKLQKIRELGARIAIDDFGTGFCNFTYLLQYQVDRLKIDQSFVRQAVNDVNAAAVVRTIIAMSHGLNMKVVAEGVETEEQLRFLLRRRCDEAQGRLFSGPVPAAEFVAMVQTLSGARVMDAFSKAGVRV